jgi:predicted RNase H-like nuclease
MSWVAGADGYKSAWCVVLLDLETGEMRSRIVPAFANLLDLPERPIVVTVDIPIGLPEFTPPCGRACEREARRVLGRRASSVFSAVGRVPLRTLSRLEAHQASKASGGIGIGAQAWDLAVKLREADEAMTPAAQETLCEVHPEVSFWAMNGFVPMSHNKKSTEGASERVDCVVRGGLPREFVGRLPEFKVGRDDFLDACAALWTARRIAEGKACRLPRHVDLDARGLDMAIWF